MIEDTVSARSRKPAPVAASVGHKERRGKSKSLQISTRFNPEDLAALHKRAQLHDMAVAQVIRRIVLGIDKPIRR